MANKKVWLSNDVELAYGKVKDFINVDNFEKAIYEQYYNVVGAVNKVRIETCIETIEGLPAESIVPLSSSDAAIENYFVADIQEKAITE